MPRFSVFVTREIPDQGIAMLRKAGCQVRIHTKPRPVTRRELVKNTKEVDALYCLLTDTIDAAFLETAGDRLKIIANYAVGFDNIDVVAAQRKNIIVTNTPAPEVSESVAEHAIALMFGLAHRIVESDRYARGGKYKGWSPTLFLGTDIKAKNIGIVGLGRIGKAITERLAAGFGIKVLYTDPRRDPAFEKQYGAKFVDLPALLKNADIVTLHVPLLPATRHLISTKELKMMKKTAFLINTARGPVVDELALIKALTRGEIAGAGIDVFECEPLIDCNPRDTYELRTLQNVIMTPHTASATIETRQAMSRLGAENIIAVMKGKTAPNAVALKS